MAQVSTAAADDDDDDDDADAADVGFVEMIPLQNQPRCLLRIHYTPRPVHLFPLFAPPLQLLLLLLLLFLLLHHCHRRYYLLIHFQLQLHLLHRFFPLLLLHW